MTRVIDAILRRGFRPSKCLRFLKTSLERIKILRSKHEIILKQTRRDVAQLLLHSGQEANPQLLQSRVEVLVKEKNMLRAYDLIQQYCDLVANRIRTVHKHKECPEDLKEAISGLCYTAPRSSELCELQQIRDLFILKYGREFVVAAAELQPDCGVSTEIIEKLSSRRASTEIKAALLKEIAEEFNTNWDSTENQSDLILAPSPNLLAGPKAFCSASQLYTLSGKNRFKDSQLNSPLSMPIRTHSIDSNMKQSTETIPYVLHPNEEEGKEGKEEENEEKEEEKEEKEGKEEEKEEEIIDADEKLPPSGDCYSLPKNAETSTESVTQEEQTGNSRNEEEMPEQIFKPEEEAISATTNTKAENVPTNLSSVTSGEGTLSLTKSVQRHHFYDKQSTTRMELDPSEDNVTNIEQNRHPRSNMHRNNSYAEEIERPNFDDSSEEDGTSENIKRKKIHEKNGNYRINNPTEIQSPTFNDSTEEEEEDRSVRKAIHGKNGHLRLNQQKRFYTQESRRPTFNDSIEKDRTTYGKNGHLRLNTKKTFYDQESGRLTFDDSTKEEEEDRSVRKRIHGQNGHMRLNNQKILYTQEIRGPTFDDSIEEDRTARRTARGKNERLRLNMQKSFYAQERRRATFDDNTEEEEEEEEEEGTARKANHGHNGHCRLNIQKNFYNQESREPTFDDSTKEEEEDRISRKANHGNNGHLRVKMQKRLYSQESRRPTFDDSTEEEEEEEEEEGRTARKANHGQNGHLRVNMQKSFYTKESRRPTFGGSTEGEEEEEEEEEEGYRYNNVHTRPKFVTRRRPGINGYNEEFGIIKSGELVQETPSHSRSRANNYYRELSPVEMIQTGATRTLPSSSQKAEYRKLRGNSDHEYYKMSKKSGQSCKIMQESNYDYKHGIL